MYFYYGEPRSLFLYLSSVSTTVEDNVFPLVVPYTIESTSDVTDIKGLY